MALRVVAEVGDRDDDRLATVGGALVSATNTAITRWRDGLIWDSTTVADENRPGPLVDLGNDVIGWGPCVWEDGRDRWPLRPLLDAAVADVGQGVSRYFDLVTAAAGGGGERVALALKGRLPRVQRSERAVSVDPSLRLVVMDTFAKAPVETLPDDELSVMAWGSGPLLVGAVGGLRKYADSLDLETTLDTHDPTAPLTVATRADGSVAAGMASGWMVEFTGDGRLHRRWSAHQGPVTAIAWAPDSDPLATGGEDGYVRLWTDGAPVAELHVGAPAQALAWLGTTQLAVKAGRLGGTIALISP